MVLQAGRGSLLNLSIVVLTSINMLKNHRKPVSLSFSSTDLPIHSFVETAATLYRKDRDRFHLLLNEPGLYDRNPDIDPTIPLAGPPRLLWLEISPYRVVMTMQGNGKLSYRHFWEQGMYGLSRYWLSGESANEIGQMRLRNFTRRLILTGSSSQPEHLRIEYELWCERLNLGQYVLSLDIHH